LITLLACHQEGGEKAGYQARGCSSCRANQPAPQQGHCHDRLPASPAARCTTPSPSNRPPCPRSRPRSISSRQAPAPAVDGRAPPGWMPSRYTRKRVGWQPRVASGCRSQKQRRRGLGQAVSQPFPEGVIAPISERMPAVGGVGRGGEGGGGGEGRTGGLRAAADQQAVAGLQPTPDQQTQVAAR